MLTSIWLHSVAGLVTTVYGYKFLRSLGWRKGVVMGLTRELMVKGKGNTFVTLALPIVGAIEVVLGSGMQALIATVVGTKDKYDAAKIEAAKIEAAIERFKNPATAPTVKIKRPAVSMSDTELLVDMMVELETKMWKSHDQIMTMLHPIVMRNRDKMQLCPDHAKAVADAMTEGFKGPYSKSHDIKRKEDNRARRELREEVDFRRLEIPYFK